MRRFVSLIFAVGFVLAVLLPGCASDRTPEPGNVVLITIDTLRADRISGDGYPLPTTPFLDSLAAEGTMFSVCRAPCSWTAPSMASLFTSVYSRQHGVRHGLVRRGRTLGQEALAESFLTLAEALQAKGYRTYGVSSNRHVTPQAGMAQGFDEFVSLGFCNADEVHDAALKLKEDLAGEGPFFLWIHYYDPHAPYEIHQPWVESHASRPELAQALSAVKGSSLSRQAGPCQSDSLRLQTLESLYDGEVHYSDGALRKLFEEVLSDVTASVIVTSDHGEHFLEHSLLDHGQSLYEEVIRVPLVIVPENPSHRGQTLSAPTSLLDVYPTILEMNGLPVPPGLAGQSLVPLLEGEHANSGRLFYAELDRVAIFLDCIIADGWKLVLDKEDRQAPQLYDLNTDPAEQLDLVKERPEIAADLEARLRAWREAKPVFSSENQELELTPEQEEQLRSLGYVK